MGILREPLRARRYSERRVTAAWRLPDYGLEVDRYSGGAPVAVVETPDPGLGHDPPLCPWLYLARPRSVAVQGLVGP